MIGSFGYVFALLALFFFSISSSAQPPDKNSEDQPVNVKTVLVNVPVVVGDAAGRNISGLTRENFAVTQGGITQPIEFFASQEGPATFAIIIDSSGSTGAVLRDIAGAAKKFLRILGPEDKGLVVSFDNEVSMLLDDFTSDKGRLKDAINNVQTVGGPGSVMNDAVYRIITKEFRVVKGKKAIIVLTDGDVDGKVSHSRLMTTLAESDVVVYPVFYQTRRLLPSNVKTISFSELVKVSPVDRLYSMALTTGGRLYVADGSDFTTAFQNIAAELKKQYVIGFYPSNTNSGDVNDIKIEVDRPGATVRTKQTIKVHPVEPQNQPRSKYL